MINLWQIYYSSQTVVVAQSLGHVWLFATPWTAAHQASLSFTISRSLLKLKSFVLWVGDTIQPDWVEHNHLRGTSQMNLTFQDPCSRMKKDEEHTKEPSQHHVKTISYQEWNIDEEYW